MPWAWMRRMTLSSCSTTVGRRPLAALEEHGAEHVGAVEELGGRAVEPHLALLEEDGPVGDRQRHVGRLLDEHDRAARRPGLAEER